MRIDVDFKYRSGAPAWMTMTAYEISNEVGLSKVIAVLGKLGEAMAICNPEAEKKEPKDDKQPNPKPGRGTESSVVKDGTESNQGVN